MTELDLRPIAGALHYRCTSARYFSVLQAHADWWTPPLGIGFEPIGHLARP